MVDPKRMMIVLPQGGTVELDYTDLFEEQIRKAFNLDPAAEITPDHVRAFMINELGTALRMESQDAASKFSEQT